MAIPNFNEDGNLPAGIHEAEWEEVKIRFGGSGHRRSLLRGLEKAMKLLKMAGCTRIYIDGSFVTSKKSPRDFDACWEENGVDFNLLDAVFLDLRSPRASQKALFGGELFPASAPASGSSPFLTFFQNSREGFPKGIITINLERWQP
ncbi:hypothetical protein JYK02_06905 [Corallococcus macrosporus]|uniref:Uncharacterized protein n=1 Tax=Corallococcus macrosporus TaxID=35 RepID=A0ABS3D6E4_9BACT|nr:hypothetical protein [Corallococcus macrosporus]MBN8227239.1 hypothetical protein [Corallococcus macrosporus]